MLGFPNIRQVYPEPGRFPGPALLGLTNPTSVGVWLLVLGAACFMLWWKSKKAFWVSVATLFLAFLTLLPVLGNLQPRHLLVPIVAFSIAVAAGLSWWRGASRWRALAGIGLVVFQLSVLPSSPTWDLRRELSMYRSEGGFLMTADPEGRLLTAIPHSHFLACLHRLSLDGLSGSLHDRDEFSFLRGLSTVDESALSRGTPVGRSGLASLSGSRVKEMPKNSVARDRSQDAGVIATPPTTKSLNLEYQMEQNREA